ISYADGGSRSRRRFSSSSSPKPPRAFGGRSACSSRARSFARSTISAVFLLTSPSRSWISLLVFWADSSRPSTFVSSCASRRTIVGPSDGTCGHAKRDRPRGVCPRGGARWLLPFLLGARLRRLIPLFLRHLIVLAGAVLRSTRALLRRAFPAQRRIPFDVAG